MANDSTISDRFVRDGFVIVPGVLDAPRIAPLRRKLQEAHVCGASVPTGGGHVLFDPGSHVGEARATIGDPRVLEIARQLIGNRVLDVHQSAAHFGAVNRGWHKDCADYMQKKRDGLDWTSGYGLVHFAFYLQDHVRYGGGISLRVGSHRTQSDRRGEIVTPAVRAGDVVAFDLRTTHYGNTMQLRARRRPVFADRLWRMPGPLARFAPWGVAANVVRHAPWLFLPEHGRDRIVLFAMYGADNDHTHRFFAWLRTQSDLAHVRGYDAPTPFA